MREKETSCCSSYRKFSFYAETATAAAAGANDKVAPRLLHLHSKLLFAGLSGNIALVVDVFQTRTTTTTTKVHLHNGLTGWILGRKRKHDNKNKNKNNIIM